ncbi:MAG: type VI secretion system contractile sheath domain-containing protein, partial [Planctomycetia bacterium]
MTPEPEMAAAASQAAASTTESISLLEQAIGATKQTDRSRTEDLLRTLVGEALQGQVTWDKNVTQTIKERMRAIDAVMSKQLAAIMHAEAFQKLEGSWRGLHYHVFNSETSASLKIKVLNVSKKDLFKDLDKAVEFDQSQMFKKLYENEFGTPGGEPYGAMIGDYEFD